MASYAENVVTSVSCGVGCVLSHQIS